MILIILVIILATQPLNKQENLDTSILSNEALQNIAKVYSDVSGTVSFNNVNITGNLNMIPRGTIVMWNGTIAPSGWGLCDGTQGTPDLRGRFVLGYNKDQPRTNGGVDDQGYVKTGTGARLNFEKCNEIGMTGGEAYHYLTVKEMPAHSHTYYPTRSWHEGGHGTIVTGGSDAGTVTLNTDNTGGSDNHNTIPPYYVLAYIMKL